MRTLLAALCAVVLTAFVAPPAGAAEAYTSSITAGLLYEGCVAPQNSPDFALCMMYVTGFSDGYAEAAIEDIAHGAHVTGACWGEKTSHADFRLAFVVWVQSHPDKIKVAATDAMAAALGASFPCKK